MSWLKLLLSNDSVGDNDSVFDDSQTYLENWHEMPEFKIEHFVQHYGETSDPREAAYILADGRMLDFTEPGQAGQRSLDHSDIGGGFHGIMEFMRRSGAVRFAMFSDGLAIDFMNQLTQPQIRVIQRCLPQVSHFAVDIRDSTGKILFSERTDGKVGIGRLWRRVLAR